MNENHDFIPTKEIGELLDEVTDKLPKLFSGLISTMYSADAGKSIGQAVGAMYKEMIDMGIPKEDALQMARDYMQGLKDVTKSMNFNGGQYANQYK